MAGKEQYRTINAFISGTAPVRVGIGGTGPDADHVPVDHVRYVHALKYWNLGGESVVTVREDYGGIFVPKDLQRLTANQDKQWPENGPQEIPVMTFRGSSVINIQVSGGAGTTSGIGVTLVVIDKPGGA